MYLLNLLQVTFLRSVMSSLLVLSCCFLLRALKAMKTQYGSRVHLLLFPIRFKNPSVLLSFPFYCYFSPVRTRCRARRNAKSGPTMNDNKKHQQKPKGQTRLSYLPWTYNAPAYLNAHPAPPFQPNPRPPAKSGMLGDSDLFTQKSHLGFSGRLGGGRGTGSV